MLRYDLGVLGNNLENVSAQLNVTNLADETYATCLANNFCNYGNGRTVYVSLKYAW
jgi:iron complex outermembrane receptor protein